MKKKAMALLLTAAMAASVLTGCGSGDGGSGSQASGSQGGQEDSGTAEESKADGEEAADEGQEAGDDGEYYVDEDGNKYKKFDDVQLKMLICWNGGFKTAADQ